MFKIGALEIDNDDNDDAAYIHLRWRSPTTCKCLEKQLYTFQHIFSYK